MNILDAIVSETAEQGDGTVSSFEKDGKLYLLNIIFDTKEEDLYIIPAKVWAELQKKYEMASEDYEDICTEFWIDVEKYLIGSFDVN